MSANRYIRFVELSYGLIRDSRIPLFSSKFSRRNYTTHQLLILLLLKEYLSEDYRDKVGLNVIMDSLRENIHLNEVPHFTTIHRFCQWIRSSTFSQGLNRLTKMLCEWGKRYPVRLSTPPGSRALKPVTIIPREPVKQENDS